MIFKTMEEAVRYARKNRYEGSYHITETKQGNWRLDHNDKKEGKQFSQDMSLFEE